MIAATASPLVQQLLDTIAACKRQWGDDPAFADIARKLDEAGWELDVILASPGKRAALRAAMPNPAGQEPSSRREAPSKVQKSGAY